MEREGKKRAVVGPLFFMLLGGLTGAVLSLLYAPSNGESTRHYLHMQSERARRRARGINTRIRDIIDTLIEEIKGTTDRVVETGVDITQEEKNELIMAIETGKDLIEVEKKRVEQLFSKEEEA